MTLTRKAVLHLSLAAAVLSSAIPARAGITGSISGTVLDPTGAVIAGKISTFGLQVGSFFAESQSHAGRRVGRPMSKRPGPYKSERQPSLRRKQPPAYFRRVATFEAGIDRAKLPKLAAKTIAAPHRLR
jgi:hypothetical protein